LTNSVQRFSDKVSARGFPVAQASAAADLRALSLRAKALRTVRSGCATQTGSLPNVMSSRKQYRLVLPKRVLELGRRTLVMGVLNVTPDSFSDGGRYFDARAAVVRALEMEHAGADIIDIGGESTRPGAAPVSAAEEMERVLPVLDGLRGKLGIPISLDTQKAAIAEAGIAAGAEIINDVSALRSDPALGEVVRRHGAALISMHMRGTPGTMQQGPFARAVMRDVLSGLRAAIARARRARIPQAKLLLDPGIGFGKSYEQNCELLRRMPELARLGYPLVVGTSRKAFIGWLLGGKQKDRSWPADQRKWGTAATVTAAILGGAHIVRVHEVAEMVQVARVADGLMAVSRARGSGV
jgi:dihydropteroate synthase